MKTSMNTTATRNWEGCRRSALQARQESKRSALPPTVPPLAERENHDPQVVAGHCLRGILGTSTNCSTGECTSSEPEEIDQLFSHLRHRHIENRNVGTDLVDVLAVCRSTVMLASYLRQRCWQDPAGLIIKEVEKLRLERRFFLDHGRDVQLVPLSRSWPCSVPLGRRGVESRPGAWRRLAVRAEGTGVTVALAASWRSLRLQHNVPTTSIQQRSPVKNGNACRALLLFWTRSFTACVCPLRWRMNWQSTQRPRPAHSRSCVPSRPQKILRLPQLAKALLRSSR